MNKSMPVVTPQFLSDSQYNQAEILRDERIFGRNFYNIGGRRENERILDLAGPITPARVLDVGCGLGGPARLIADRYGAHVDGVDVSAEMIDIARSRLASENRGDDVVLFHSDILDFDTGTTYDLVFSNCAFLHIHNKDRLVSRIRSLLRPQGALLFADFCIGEDGPEMRDYVERYRYDIRRFDDWDELLARHGFQRRHVEDGTERHAEYCREALGGPGINDEWHDVLTKRLDRIDRGQHRWGIFHYGIGAPA